MNGPNFLQRPGGLGPMADRVKPIGTLATEKPSMYLNTRANIEMRRAMMLDDVNRIQSQYNRDRGESAREPVGPIQYGDGNIVASAEITGPAGYNPRDQLQLPMRPLDMNKAEYLVKTQNSMDPNLRAQMQVLTTAPRQNFFNAQDPSAYAYTQNYVMPDSLPVQLPPETRK